ncbi:CAMK/CAMKL/KIN4 protein kinase [Gaeumannomyces tritici R3-111a-1]|uniref:non-specific serine/threonine protein kinase n=1 Tax=Gaeumannomyces tritici (strain R3-111a-1) TaxID=644352 RepID=J3PJY9_GAET3|nr:CAMK/CAMKL/KIN4 protein kinase [Gaeumannomyces tritici R3-111a-1]EJT68597.1 CAMK/CAMKL/KIN4 protein kinase [Gaeumannomyces tritici R3-111a-1]
MDPLSIAASVAGLLGAGAKLIAIMSPIVHNGDAPPLCRSVLTDLCDVTAILHQLEHFLAGRLLGGRSVPPERRELVLFEQLAAALTGCVITKDELETLVDDLGLVYNGTGVTGTFDRARWMHKEKDIARVLSRLQNHKSSLNCMLTIFSAGSIADINNSVVRLYALVEQAVASDSTLSARLARLEGADSMVGRPDTEVGTVRACGSDGGDAHSIRTVRQLQSGDQNLPHADFAEVGAQLSSLAFELEMALQSSRVYRRQLITSDGHSETSVTTSTRRRAAASIFSAISLADISNLSQYSLPILIQEVGNNRWYIQMGRPANDLPGSDGGDGPERYAATNGRAQNSPRRAPDNRTNGSDQLTAFQGEHSSSNSRRKERQHYAPAPHHGVVPQRGGSSRDPRASGAPTVLPVRTHTGASTTVSSSKDPSREASEIMHSILISQPEVDIEREKERLASDHGVDDAAPPPVVAPAETRGARSRHDHSKREKHTKFGEYILGNTIGKGEFSKVKLAWKQEGGVRVAIKLIKKGAHGSNLSHMSGIMREVHILKHLTHPNIVRLHRMNESERHYGIILEYASGGDLFDYILRNRYIKDHAARRLFAQLVSGVGYMHKKGIVHRDLKLENLLLDRNRNIIITNFGFANTFNPNEELTEEEEEGLWDKEFVKKMGLDKIGLDNPRKGDLMLTKLGSPCYAAPELVVTDLLYTGRKVDVWSCGVILYAMLAGHLPFDDDPANTEGDNINLLYKYIVSTPLTFPEYVTPHARDLLRRILVPNPRRRADLVEVARHSWLSEYAHVVELVIISTTTHTEIRNSTVPAEDAGENGSVVRSASVRESLKKTPASLAAGGLATKQGGVHQGAGHARQQDNKRRTVQVEYVAPTTQAQRGEPSNTQSTLKQTREDTGGNDDCG